MSPDVFVTLDLYISVFVSFPVFMDHSVQVGGRVNSGLVVPNSPWVCSCEDRSTH